MNVLVDGSTYYLVQCSSTTCNANDADDADDDDDDTLGCFLTCHPFDDWMYECSLVKIRYGKDGGGVNNS